MRIHKAQKHTDANTNKYSKTNYKLPPPMKEKVICPVTLKLKSDHVDKLRLFSMEYPKISKYNKGNTILCFYLFNF